MAQTIGYYVHHHGRGHFDRFRAIRAASTHELVPLGELPVPGGVHLPGDVPSLDAGSTAEDPTAGGALHWAPLDVSTAAPRLRRIVEWIDDRRPSGIVIDVSVEAALTCRLAGAPTVVVRQHGRRDDAAHQLAYRSARRLLAPFPAELEHPATPTEVVAKTDYAGFVVGPPDSGESPASSTTVAGSDVVVLWGRGGGALPAPVIDVIAEVAGGAVHCAGAAIWPGAQRPRSTCVRELGWFARPSCLLTARPLVVSAAGNSSVALAAAHRCPLVLVPQARPFDEQAHLAERMAATGVATIAPSRPDRRAWAEAIAGARQGAAHWERLGQPFDGAREAARIIGTWLG